MFSKVLVLILEDLLFQIVDILKFSLYTNNGLQKMRNISHNKDLESVLEKYILTNRIVRKHINCQGV